MKFFSLERPAFRWGDYGDILLHGMAARGESSGLLELERAGPFVPPISFPGLPGILVTGHLKSRLEDSRLTGFTFQPVTKKRIVDLDWMEWGSGDEEPPFYPESGEPDDYIFALSHDDRVAFRMPELWELVLKTTANVERREDLNAEFGVHLRLRYETWNGDDFFRAPEVLYDFVTERAKTWLENEVAEFVSFRRW
jgi:hypothetical protein